MSTPHSKPSQREQQFAKLSRVSQDKFFRVLDRNCDGFISLADLVFAANKYKLCFEIPRNNHHYSHLSNSVSASDAPLLMPLEEQTEAVLREMYFEALHLRGMTGAVKGAQPVSSNTKSGGAMSFNKTLLRDPSDSLMPEDLVCALSFRWTTHVNIDGTTEKQIFYHSKFRPYWIALLICIVPHPFEPLDAVGRSAKLQPNPLDASEFKHAPPLTLTSFRNAKNEATNSALSATIPAANSLSSPSVTNLHSLAATALLPSQSLREAASSSHQQSLQGVGGVTLSATARLETAPLPQSMYEREATHAKEMKKSARLEKQSMPHTMVAPGILAHKSSFNKSVLLHQSPLAQSAGASYSFTRPVVTERSLTEKELRERSTRAQEEKDKEERGWSVRKQKIKALAAAIDQKARQATLTSGTPLIVSPTSFDATAAGILHSWNVDGSAYDYTATTNEYHDANAYDEEEAKVNSTSANDDFENPYALTGTERSPGEKLSASQLDTISFLTNEEFQAQVGREKLQSESLDYRDDAAQHLTGDAGQVLKKEDSSTDLLAQTLLAHSKTNARSKVTDSFLSKWSSSSHPGETARERVVRVVTQEKKSYSTSGQFRPPFFHAAQTERIRSGLNKSGAQILSRNNSALSPVRWVNPNAKVGSDARTPNGSSKQQQQLHQVGGLTTGSATSKFFSHLLQPVSYDDQGRPLQTEWRSALLERVTDHPGVIKPTERRKKVDQLQSELLSAQTERAQILQPIPDPLDALLAPFVPLQNQARPLDALNHALTHTPSVASLATAARNRAQTQRSQAATATSRSAANKERPASALSVSGLYEPGEVTTAAVDWIQPDRDLGPKFNLNFHLPSTQDDRDRASKELSLHPSANDPPTIANGGITTLAQLKPGYTPPSINALSTSLSKTLNRDGSVGDISLMDPRNPELVRIIARQKLDAQRKPFRLDFKQGNSTAGLSSKDVAECSVITRDGGLTTAEESEKWRRAQLGIGANLKSSNLTIAQQERLKHIHTNGRVVRVDHLAPGAHTARHMNDFSTLMGEKSALDLNTSLTYPLLAVTEREAYMVEIGHQDQLQREKEEEQRRTEFAKLRPSERSKLKEIAADQVKYQQFPFRSLYQVGGAEKKNNTNNSRS